jgi:5'-nucleotidase (lipoprotein e(P4) family)
MLRSVVSSAAICSLLLLGAAPQVEPTYVNLNAVLWMQTSVEYRASVLETYRWGKSALLRALKDPLWTAALEQTGDFSKLPPAVILDLDETVLDNSAFEARLAASGRGYSDQAWVEWVNERAAGLLPGAKDFLEFAAAKHVTPIYITNRVCDPTKPDDPTAQVLRRLGLPLDPAPEHLLCDDGNKGDKTERRTKCAAKLRILLMFGDQLGDFLPIPPASANLAGRDKLFVANGRMWGERWFQLPNPTYGSWEAAVGFTVPQKLTHLRP